MWTLNIYYTLHLQCVVLLSAGQVFSAGLRLSCFTKVIQCLYENLPLLNSYYGVRSSALLLYGSALLGE
jgi:hypothetical protein